MDFHRIDRIRLFLSPSPSLGNPIVKLFIDGRGIIGIAVCTHVAFAFVLAKYNSGVCHSTRMIGRRRLEIAVEEISAREGREELNEPGRSFNWDVDEEGIVDFSRFD